MRRESCARKSPRKMTIVFRRGNGPAALPLMVLNFGCTFLVKPWSDNARWSIAWPRDSRQWEETRCRPGVVRHINPF